MNATQQSGQEEEQSALEQFGINLTDRALPRRGTDPAGHRGAP